MPSFDGIVIGGGFYGCEIALELKRLGFERILLVERERDLLRRASWVNQARVHNGYHYPRSYSTGVRSRRNFARFADEYGEAIQQGFTKLYAIAAGSQVSASQFAAFCDAIEAPCRPAPESCQQLFDGDLVEECFLTEEHAFDAERLAERQRKALDAAKIEVRTGTSARIERSGERHVEVDAGGRQECAGWVFNCTYSGLEEVGLKLRTAIKREMTEMILIEPPVPVRSIGVTVMDGPYFSTMPFPATGLHSLSHVRYTPHHATSERGAAIPLPERSNRDFMLRDAARYMPALSSAKVVKSIFEVKTLLKRSEGDDGRPILAEWSEEHPRALSVLGAKIDNIYDVREYLRGQSW